jgi:hypothetical protein
MSAQLLERIKKLHKVFHDGYIPTISNHEVHPDNPIGSRENYLYFTLPPSLNFQRQSPAMWKSAFATWNDPETNYLFFPEKVVAAPYEKVQADLRKHKLSLQPNKHTDIWIALCKALNKYWDNDPRKLIKDRHSCVTRIINYLQENKKEYPYLNGAKMSNYWLYILDHYTDIALQNKHKLSIIPDTHVAQCSVHLGIIEEGATPDQIADAWFALLKDSGLTPVEMHPVLWNWSRNNFQPEV